MASEAVETGGDLIIDDTTWQRFGRKLEAASFVWDSTLGKRIFGMQVVLLLWTNGKRRIPFGLRIWHKGGKSKVKLAQELLWEARRGRLNPEYVLFDSCYSAESLLNLIDGFDVVQFFQTRNSL